MTQSATSPADRRHVTLDGRSPGPRRPSVEATADAVLSALLRSGRWRDAANYFPSIPDGQPPEYAQLLLGAARSEDAHVVLAVMPPSDEGSSTDWRSFVSTVDATMRGDQAAVAELITLASTLPAHPLVALLMMRAAEVAGANDIAVHYAHELCAYIRTMLTQPVWSPETSCAGASTPPRCVIDDAERGKGADLPSPLDALAIQLAAFNRTSDLRALVTIGRFIHRENDPTQPITDTERDARQRWRIAYRSRGPRRVRANVARFALLAVGSAVSIKIGYPVLAVGLGIAIGIWQRRRPLPGMDLRTSRIVRGATDPLLYLRTRRYRATDVFTLIVTFVIGCGLAVRLPLQPSWLMPTGIATAVILSLAALPTRRRYIRRQRQELRPPPLDPSVCRCLDAVVLHGPQADRYIENISFQLARHPARHTGLFCSA